MPNEQPRIRRDRCRIHGLGVGAATPSGANMSQPERLGPPREPIHSFTDASVARSSIALLRFRGRITFCGLPFLRSWISVAGAAFSFWVASFTDQNRSLSRDGSLRMRTL